MWSSECCPGYPSHSVHSAWVITFPLTISSTFLLPCYSWETIKGSGSTGQYLLIGNWGRRGENISWGTLKKVSDSEMCCGNLEIIPISSEKYHTTSPDCSPEQQTHKSSFLCLSSLGCPIENQNRNEVMLINIWFSSYALYHVFFFWGGGMPCRMQSLSSPTRDETHASWGGNVES